MKKKLTLALALVCLTTTLTACGSEKSIDDIDENDIDAVIDSISDNDLESIVEQGADKIDDAVKPDSGNSLQDAVDDDIPSLEEMLGEPDKATKNYEKMFAFLPEVEVTPASDFVYSNNGSGVNVTDYIGTSTTIRIPDEIGGLPVIEVSLTADMITELILPDTVAELDVNTEYLQYINIPSALRTPIMSAEHLKAVYINDGTKSIIHQLFRGCTSLSEISIPDTVTSISSEAFYGCISLTEVELPKYLVELGHSAFYGSGLKSITLPEYITQLGNENLLGGSIFADCKSLESVVLPDKLTLLGNSTFARCDMLKEITLPEGITAIPDNCFHQCIALESVNIPDRVVEIGSNAFAGCTVLSDISIPESVIGIKNGAFSYCDALEKLTLPDGLIDMKHYTVFDKTFYASNNLTVTYKGNEYTSENMEELYALFN